MSTRDSRTDGLAVQRHLKPAISRQIGEELRVGSIIVFVDSITQGTVRLIIRAPKSMPVHRAEIYNVLLSEDGGIHSQDKRRSQRPRYSGAPDDFAYVAIARHAHESVMVGDDVEIGVDDVGSNAATLTVGIPGSLAVVSKTIENRETGGETGGHTYTFHIPHWSFCSTCRHISANAFSRRSRCAMRARAIVKALSERLKRCARVVRLSAPRQY